jgi:diacylglycerol kinase family enzyme
MKCWLAIANPRSGGNGNTARLSRLLDALQRQSIHTELTCGPGHAAEIASNAQGFAGIVAVGGDGTVFEILKGIDRSRQRLALVANGRGNTLARDLRLLGRRESLDVLHWQPERFIDLMDVTITSADGVHSRHLSASTVALGYPTEVVQQARKLPWLARHSYIAAACSIRPRHFSMHVEHGETEERSVRLSGFIANNTRHLANILGFREACFNDGRFETMEMDAGIAKQTLHNLSALSGTRIYEPYPLMQTTRTRVRLDEPKTLMIDGEIFQQIVSIDVRILPSALACNGPGGA